MRTFPLMTLISAVILQTLIIESNVGDIYYSIVISMAFTGFVLLIGILGILFIYNRYFRNGKKQN